MAKQKPTCYGCRYREPIPGDAHSRCGHPGVKSAGLHEAVLATLFYQQLSLGYDSCRIGDLSVELNPIGVKGGWALWPWNFDPTWLVKCSGFEKILPDPA